MTRRLLLEPCSSFEDDRWPSQGAFLILLPQAVIPAAARSVFLSLTLWCPTVSRSSPSLMPSAGNIHLPNNSPHPPDPSLTAGVVSTGSDLSSEVASTNHNVADKGRTPEGHLASF